MTSKSPPPLPFCKNPGGGGWFDRNSPDPFFLNNLNERVLKLKKKFFSTVCICDNKQQILLQFCSPPRLLLISLVFELRRWPGYQNCSKFIKVFDYVLKFCILPALKAKIAYWLETKITKKCYFFLFLPIFVPIFSWVIIPIIMSHLAFFWLFQRQENIFSYPYDVSSTSRSKSARTWKIKIFFFKKFEKFDKFKTILIPWPSP